MNDLVDELHEIQRVALVEIVAPEDRVAERHCIDRPRLAEVVRRQPATGTNRDLGQVKVRKQRFQPRHGRSLKRSARAQHVDDLR